jgi:hypothetical protein
VIVPLFGAGLQGKSPTITSQHRINCYAELTKDNDKSPMSILGTPGLELFCDLDAIYSVWATQNTTYLQTIAIGGGPIRCLIYYESADSSPGLFGVRGGTVFKVNQAGQLSYYDTLNAGAQFSGEEIIDIGLYNDTAGLLRIAMTDGNNPAYFVPETVQRVPDSDSPHADTMAMYGTDLLVQQSSSPRFYRGETVTIWDPLDFATAESSTDNLLRIFRDRDTIILFGGRDSTEFWTNTGGQDLPYAPIRGSAIEWGLAARWSVAKADGVVMFLARNPSGQVRLIRLNGYQAIPVSDQEWDSLVNGYERTDDAEAFAYTMGGHPFYQITFPTACKTWLFDGSNGMFSELKSGDSRHRARLHEYAWSTHFVTDYENGKIYKLKSDVYSDNGDEIQREIRTRHFFKDYDRVAVSELQVDFDSGVGLTTGQGSNPQVMLQISKDNGKGFGNELWKSIGAGGKTLTRAVWRRLGMGRDWVFKIRMSDPVPFRVTGASIDATPVKG